jgi:hypothetical protein
MPQQDIELSREGIRISYLRLLSDSSAGFIAILFLSTSYYFPVFGVELKRITDVQLSTQAKVFLAVSLALLASPLGLAINASSWLFLGWLQIRLQKRWSLGDSWITWL